MGGREEEGGGGGSGRRRNRRQTDAAEVEMVIDCFVMMRGNRGRASSRIRNLP